MKKSCLLYLLLPLLFLVVSQVASFGFKTHLLSGYKAYLVNYFLWFLIFVFCLSLFKKRSSSLVLYLTIFSLFSLINHLKIKFLNLFLIINDVFLIKNLPKFLPDAIQQLKFIEIIGILITLFIIYKIIKFIKKRINKNNLSLKFRIILFIFSSFILTYPVFFSSQFTKIINYFKIDIFIWGPIENCNSNGILFCFYDDLKNITNPPPPDYRQETIKKIYSSIPNENDPLNKDTSSTEKPTIIVILSEAFFDATKLKNIKFSTDPIPNIRQDITATMISPTIGTATANIEFEFLTGLSNYYLHGVIPYSQSIRKDIPSLFSHFKQAGYKTTAIHPYFAAMYNRPQVYRNFGIDQFISQENMPNAQYLGSFISDKTLADEILKQYSSTTQPQFIFALSMQNHFPFKADAFPKQPVEIEVDTSLENYNILKTYTDGIHLTDQAYLFLKNELSKDARPVILVLFGDHLPLLNPGFKVYQDINYDTENQVEMRSTPITIWSNFNTSLDIKHSLLSPNFLGLEILKIAKIKPQYQFSYLQSISSTDTVLQANITPKLSSQQIKNYQLIQHDLLFGKQFSLKIN